MSVNGYIYAMANDSMPGLLKVGMTEREPTDRLRDANSSDTWRPPTPFKIMMAKAVREPRAKEASLHALLAKLGTRINTNREFFRISMEDARLAFDLLDGEYWSPAPVAPTGTPAAGPDIPLIPVDLNTLGTTPPITTRRDMSRVFTDGQRIRHTIGDHTILGRYDASENGIIHDGITYSMSGFALAHHRSQNTGRPTANGWAECECEQNGEWVTTLNLRG
jgi:hypothetical protein